MYLPDKFLSELQKLEKLATGPTKVLITGGSGFLGQHLTVEFKRLGMNVAFTFVNCSELKVTGCGRYYMNLQDEVSIRNVVKEFKPNAVVHCAEARGPHVQDSDSAHHANVKGTMLLIEALIEERVPFLFIFISTDEVYKGATDCVSAQPCGESEELNVIDFMSSTRRPHVLHKMELEKYVSSHVRNHIIFRASNIYGYPCLEESSLQSTSKFSKIVASLKAGIQIELPNHLWRSPCLIDDAVTIITRAFILFIMSPEDGEVSYPRIYNLTSGHDLTTEYEMGKGMCRALGLSATLIVAKEAPVPDLEEPLHASEVNMHTNGSISRHARVAEEEIPTVVCLSNDNIREHLEIEPRTLEEGLRRTRFMIRAGDCEWLGSKIE
ncbi:hypothetical protein CYMTET_10995 [Cymbomonas tetramitiformis]|uniref:NAD-dependent epimerase/dehydratase domain-containing protein n=1 Tax=Cymbomonas tetramitiformis TaxID=36881 RepID=A0AAE0GN58_9CHLO|nr:hypothetical protein CYMTET_10995 [Cymbomonas tetramitiformis]